MDRSNSACSRRSCSSSSSSFSDEKDRILRACSLLSESDSGSNSGLPADIPSGLTEVDEKIARLDFESQALFRARNRLQSLHKRKRQDALAKGGRKDGASDKVLEGITKAVQMNDRRIETNLAEAKDLLLKRRSMEKKHHEFDSLLASSEQPPTKSVERQMWEDMGSQITASVFDGITLLNQRRSVLRFISVLFCIFLFVTRCIQVFNDVKVFTPV